MVGGSPPESASYTDTTGTTCWYPNAAAAFFSRTATRRPWLGRLRSFAVSSGASRKNSRRYSTGPMCRRISIIGAHGLVISPARSRRLSPSVVGGPVVQLDCGHSPFLSVPEDLARSLDGLAWKGVTQEPV
jgi:hypothetical protein